MGADFLFAITEYIPNDSPEREALYKKINRITDFDFPFDDIDPEINLEEYLTEAFEYLDCPGRDLAILELKGSYYWLAGGMSWGDVPSQACDYIWFIDNLRTVSLETKDG